MTVNYRIADGTDLDAVFKARSGAAATAVGFRDSAGADLSQRYEQRGSTTARAATNYRNSSGVDLAQIFMDINALVTTTHSMGAAGSGNVGYSDGGFMGPPVIGTMSPGSTGPFVISQLMTVDSLTNLFMTLGRSPTPPNNDTTFSKVEITGIFSDSGSTQTKTLLRTDASWTDEAPLGYPGAQFVWSLPWKLVTGRTYTVVFTRSS